MAKKPLLYREEQLGRFLWRYDDSREGQSGSGLTTYVASFREQQRALTPSYRALAGGKTFSPAPLPYVTTWGRYSAGSMDISMKYPWYNPDMAWHVWWGSQSFHWTKPWDMPSTRGKAILKLASMMPGKTEVNIPVAFAERKDTIDTVINGAQRLVSAARHVKRGDVVGAANALGVDPRQALTKAAKRRGIGRKTAAVTDRSSSALDAVSQRWLDLQYGWKPLLSDIESSAKLLASKFRERKPVTTFTASASDRGSTPVVYNSALWPYAGVPAGEVFYKTQCRVSVTIAPDEDASRVLGETGITNPGLVAWELVPFSFVADWFLPVGDYLEALNAFSGLTFRSGFITQKCVVEGYVSVNFHRSDFMGGGSYVHYNGSGSFTEGFFRREILGDFPQPEFPRFKNPVSPSHAATAGALLHQLQKVFRS